MAHRLRLVLFVQCVDVLSQTCHTECLQDTSVVSTTVNVMMFNVSQALNWYSTQEWYDRKTAEFKALFPAIAVTLVHVQMDDMVNEARF